MHLINSNVIIYKVMIFKMSEVLKRKFTYKINHIPFLQIVQFQGKLTLSLVT